MKIHAILISAVLFSISLIVRGQITITLAFPDQGSKTYIARDKIEFLRGYEYTRVDSHTLVAYLDSEMKSVYCMENPFTANFLIDTEVGIGDTVQFIQVSQPDPIVFLWNFGDGSTSTLADPVHTYLVAGSYTVSLTTSNKECSGSITKTITVLPDRTEVSENSEEESVFFSILEASLSPNPSNGRYTVHVLLSRKEEITLQFLTRAGLVFAQEKIIGTEINQHFDFSFLPAGMYIVQITAGNRSKAFRFLKL